MEAVLTPVSISNRVVRGFVAFFVMLVLSLGLSTTVRAQATSGEITGSVKDPAGALVVKANVVVTNEETSVAATTQTGSSGDYRVGNLIPGKYDVAVTAAGFQAFTLKGVSVELSKTSTANIGLKVGTSASVEVSADAGAVLDTTSTNLTTSFSNSELSYIPSAAIGGAGQVGVLNVSLLSPGVASTGGLGIGTGPSIGGQRPRNNNFEVEGIDNNNKAVTGPLVYIPGDAVGSFTLITNQFSPDFGHSAGGQFNTNIVSGTNTFHGRGYWYLQSRNLNAASGIAGGKVPNPNYDNNDYGGQLGGPVFKNKLFFFGNFEHNKNAQNLSNYVCTPTAAGFAALNTLQANFYSVNLQQFVKYTPVANYAGGVQVTATPGQKNSDNACFGPSAALQSTTVTDSVGNKTVIPLGNYLFNGAIPLTFSAVTTSADYTISSKDSLRVRYVHDWQASTDDGVSSGETLLPTFYTQQPFKWHLFALSEYHLFTPNLTNEFRLGFNRYSNTEVTGNFSYPGLDQFPFLTFDTDQNSFTLGVDGNAPQFTIQNLYQATDNVSWVKGKHTFKIGFDGRKYISPQGFTQRFRGDYEYTTLNVFLHDLAPDDFGQRSSGSHTYYGDQTAFYGYGNDTWRVAPTITLNVGLRYEFTSVPTGERAQQLNKVASVPGLVDFRAPQPTYTGLAPRVGIDWAPDDKTSVRAGFGIAYDVLFDNLGTLSFPPEYSVTEDVTQAPYNGAQYATNFLKNGGLPPGSGSGAIVYPNTPAGIGAARAATSAYLPDQVLPYSENYTLTIQRTFAGDYTAEIGYVGTKGIHLPTQDQINIQQRVNSTNVLGTQAGGVFVGRPGSNATTLAAINALSNIVPAWKTPADGYGGFTSKITSYQPYSYSNYNGLVANLTHRLRNGLQMSLSYTWSKTMDDATDEVFATVLTPRRQQNHQCIKCDYSRSALDRTHRLSLEAVYDVPFYKHSDSFLMKNLVGNWVIAPTYTYESPEYATVLSGVNSVLNGDTATAIDRTIINPLGQKGTGSATNPIFASNGTDIIGYTAVNPLAYYIQANKGTQPNSQRNTLPIRPIDNVDLSVYKRLTVLEHYSLEIGIQAWNVLNHPQYQPGTVDNVNGPSYTASYAFQTVTSSAFNHPEKEFLNNPRTMQLSGKIIF